MPTKTYLVKLRSMAVQQVRATKVEIYSEHLVFTNAHGGLAALFLLEVVESWEEVGSDPYPPYPTAS
jgi:hypothetical protein